MHGIDFLQMLEFCGTGECDLSKLKPIPKSIILGLDPEDLLEALGATQLSSIILLPEAWYVGNTSQYTDQSRMGLIKNRDGGFFSLEDMPISHTKIRSAWIVPARCVIERPTLTDTVYELLTTPSKFC